MIYVDPGKGQVKETLSFSLKNTRLKSGKIMYMLFFEQNNSKKPLPQSTYLLFPFKQEKCPLPFAKKRLLFSSHPPPLPPPPFPVHVKTRRVIQKPPKSTSKKNVSIVQIHRGVFSIKNEFLNPEFKLYYKIALLKWFTLAGCIRENGLSLTGMQLRSQICAWIKWILVPLRQQQHKVR